MFSPKLRAGSSIVRKETDFYNFMRVKEMRSKLLGGVALMSVMWVASPLHASEGHHGASSSSGEASKRVEHAKTNQFWWPEQLNLSTLRDHDASANPLGEDFDYAQAFNTLDPVSYTHLTLPTTPYV